MNTPEARLSPETLDELLSADIDGEFERAATDLGFTVDEARAAMHASPNMARRRTELTQARDLLAASVPVPASLTSRLVATALDRSHELRSVSARRIRSVRVVVAVGSAAAIIAGVVTFAALNHHNGPSSTAASATSPQHHAPVPRTTQGGPPQRFVDFGDVSRPSTLRTVIEMRLRTAPRAPNATAATPQRAANVAAGRDIVAKLASLGFSGSAGPVGLQGPQGLEGVEGLQGDVGIAGPTGPTGAQGVTGSAGGIGPQGPSGVQGGVQFAPAKPLARPASHTAPTYGSASAVAANAETRCTTTLERRAHLSFAPVLSGFGTDARRPVVIVVFSQRQRYVAYVLVDSDCAVVSQQTLP